MSISGGDTLGYISLVGQEVHAAGSIVDYESVDTSSPYIVSLSVVDQPTTQQANTAYVTLIVQVLKQNNTASLNCDIIILSQTRLSRISLG